MSIENRENDKAEAYKLMEDSTKTNELVNAILLLIQAHYDRSEEAYPKNHPDFKEYTQHWIHSDIPNLKAILKMRKKSDEQIKDVLSQLLRSFPKPSKLMIKKGHSYWGE